MNLRSKLFLPYHCYLLSFLIPASILALAYAHLGAAPFGGKTVLISDLSGQYVDFFSAYYEILTAGKSLLYSWHAGLGLNFWGIFAYYLASPFLLLLFILGEKYLVESILLITLFKVGCCGLSFAAFAGKRLKINSSDLILFAVLYALCSYTIVYSFNLMWLDGVLILPLVLLGVDRILKEDQYLLFLLSLLYILIANFYIAYMVGLFAFLYFLAGYWSGTAERRQQLFLRKFLLFAASSLLAAGCAAIVLLPTFYALQNSESGPSLSLLAYWNVNFKLLDLFSKAFLGSYDSLKSFGLPNIYCGLLPLILFVLYFFNPRFPIRERVIFAGLCGLMAVSLNLSVLNTFWHGFDFPDWFPYRYSFVFSFLIVFLGAKCFSALDTLAAARIAKIGGLWVGIAFLLQKAEYFYLADRVLFFNAALFSVYTVFLIALQRAKAQNRILVVCLLAFVLAESLLSSCYLLGKLDREFGYVSKEEYNKSLPYIKNVIAQIKSRDDSFYRIERLEGRSNNDPLNLQYSGVTHFSSLSKVAMNRTLNRLGFLATGSYKSLHFTGSTPLTESLLGVKYVVSPVAKGLGYTKVSGNEEYGGYLNEYYLPPAFLTDKALLSFDPDEESDPFRLQNILINLAQGNDSEQSYFLPVQVSKVQLTNAAMSRDQAGGVISEYYRKTGQGRYGTLEYTLLNPEDQQLYACFQTIDTIYDVRIMVNGKEIKRYLPVQNKQIIDLGFHKKNEQLMITLLFPDEFSMEKAYFYGLNAKNLAQALTPLQSGKLAELVVSDRSLKGKVAVGDQRLLFTSIPYDPGWQVFVDGVRTLPAVLGNAFICLELPPGEHQIVFRFLPQGLLIGATASGLSLILLFSLILHRFKRFSK